MKTIAFASCIGVLAFATANAQEFHHITADIGGGFTEPAFDSGSYLNTGWNVLGAVGFNFSSYVGAKIDVGYNDFGINGATLATVGVPGGDVHMFTATLDPVLHLTQHRRFDIYVTAGGGLFHETQQFTAPTTVFTTAFIPFFGFTPIAFGATQVLSSYTVNRPGWDAGAGVAVGGFHGAKFFAEAKFERMLVARGPSVDFIPVTFGFRW